MKKCKVMWTKVRGLLAATVLLSFWLPLAAAQQVTPTISVTVNKSMVFRLAERAKRVSVSQPAVADVVVVAPSQLLINGKAVGTTSLIVFTEKGDVSNYDLIVLPDVAALRGEFRLLLPNEKVEVGTSGPSLVLKGEVSNEVVNKCPGDASTIFHPNPPPPWHRAPQPMSGWEEFKIVRTSAGLALPAEARSHLTKKVPWTMRTDGCKRKIDGIIDLLTIKEVRQIELTLSSPSVSMLKFREIGLIGFSARAKSMLPHFWGSVRIPE
jgi:Flp pilus assembly secretin CpaC